METYGCYLWQQLLQLNPGKIWGETPKLMTDDPLPTPPTIVPAIDLMVMPMILALYTPEKKGKGSSDAENKMQLCCHKSLNLFLHTQFSFYPPTYCLPLAHLSPAQLLGSVWRVREATAAKAPENPHPEICIICLSWLCGPDCTHTILTAPLALSPKRDTANSPWRDHLSFHTPQKLSRIQSLMSISAALINEELAEPSGYPFARFIRPLSPVR